MRTFAERKRVARAAGNNIVWKALGVTLTTEGGTEHANATGPVGTDWAVSLRGGMWTIHHIPTGRMAAEVDCPLIAAMLVQALAVHFPRVGLAPTKDVADFVHGFLYGAENDPNIEDTQALVLTALMNRMGLTVFMGAPGDPGLRPGGLGVVVESGKDVN